MNETRIQIWLRMYGGLIAVVVIGMVCAVIVCAWAGSFVEEHTIEPADANALQEALMSINNTTAYPKTWWSDRTVRIYYSETVERLRTCTPDERPALKALLNHYYYAMVERGLI